MSNRRKLKNNQNNRRISNNKSSIPMVVNETGGIIEAAKMMRVLRYQEVIEPSILWNSLLSGVNSLHDNVYENNEDRYMIMVTPIDNFVSENLYNVDFISTAFTKNNDNTFWTEIGFVHDELCRMIVNKKRCIIILSHKASFLGESVVVKNSWVLDNNVLIGLDSNTLIESYSENALTGEAIEPEHGVSYDSSDDIVFNF